MAMVGTTVVDALLDAEDGEARLVLEALRRCRAGAVVRLLTEDCTVDEALDCARALLELGQRAEAAEVAHAIVVATLGVVGVPVQSANQPCWN